MAWRQGGVQFWIKDFTRDTMWPFLAGFGIVNLMAFKYLRFPDDLPDRKNSKYAEQIDRSTGRLPPLDDHHGHGHGKGAHH